MKEKNFRLSYLYLIIKVIVQKVRSIFVFFLKLVLERPRDFGKPQKRVKFVKDYRSNPTLIPSSNDCFFDILHTVCILKKGHQQTSLATKLL